MWKKILRTEQSKSYRSIISDFKNNLQIFKIISQLHFHLHKQVDKL